MQHHLSLKERCAVMWPCPVQACAADLQLSPTLAWAAASPTMPTASRQSTVMPPSSWAASSARVLREPRCLPPLDPLACLLPPTSCHDQCIHVSAFVRRFVPIAGPCCAGFGTE